MSFRRWKNRPRLEPMFIRSKWEAFGVTLWFIIFVNALITGNFNLAMIAFFMMIW